MKNLITLLLLLNTTLSIAQLKCYDPRKNYESFLKFGVGKTLIPVRDMDNRVGTTFFVEGELPNIAMGLHSTIRTGDNYLRFYGVDIPISVDSRYSFVTNKGNNLQYGGYLQVNTTGMWLDGVVAGGLVRLRHELEHVGFFIEGSIPIYGYHRKVIATDNSIDTHAWFDLIKKDFYRYDPIGRTRSTEYRITIATYFKLNYY